MGKPNGWSEHLSLLLLFSLAARPVFPGAHFSVLCSLFSARRLHAIGRHQSSILSLFPFVLWSEPPESSSLLSRHY